MKKPAFTLIEIIVVVAIISTLGVLALIAYTTTQSKTRDAKRKSDIENVKKGIDIVKLDCRNRLYPVNEDDDEDVEESFDALQEYLRVSKYINKEIKPDMKDYKYELFKVEDQIVDNVCPAPPPATGLTQKGIKPNYFLLRAKLEKGTKDPQSEESKNRCMSQIATMQSEGQLGIDSEAVDGYFYSCGQ